MAGFLYFLSSVPHRINSVGEIPEDCDLSYLGDDASIACVEVLRAGPDGSGGYIIAAEPSPKSGGKRPRMGFYPDQQKWIPVESKVGDETKVTHWIGWEPGNPPGPQDLIRDEPIGGWPLTLGEREWTIPCVSVPSGYCGLPRTYKMTAEGVKLRIAPRYQYVVDRMEEWREFFNGDKSFPTLDKTIEFAVDLLQVNYRVGLWECSSECLDLIDSSECFEIIGAGLGLPQIRDEIEAQKKTDIASGSGPASTGGAG